jgi:hypothetical protein
MHTRFSLVATMAFILAVVSVSQAGTVSIGLQETGVNGGAITTVASGSGGASFNCFTLATCLGYSFSTISVLGSAGSGVDSTNSNSFQLGTTSGGILTVYVSQQGLTNTSVPGFLSSFTSNQITTGWTVTEYTYVDPGNTAYALTDLLSKTVFTSIGTQVFGVSSPSLGAGPFSETEVFVISAPGSGDSNDTIDLVAVPEPTSMGLLGTGLLAVGGLLRKKLLA